MSLIVVGTVAYDSVETPTEKRDRIMGGSASYFSLAANFFTDVSLLAVVGGDMEQNILTNLPNAASTAPVWKFAKTKNLSTGLENTWST